MKPLPLRLVSIAAAGVLAAGVVGCSSSNTASTGDNSMLDELTTESSEEQTFETVTFGTYEQDGDESSAEEIEWYVLDQQDGKVLLISKYVLDAVAFSDVDEGVTWGGTSPRATTDVEWADSSLREWLNTEFLETAFTEEEQELLVTTTLTDTKSNVASSAEIGADSSIHVAQETEDTVFLLSVSEAKTYFANKAARVAYPTQYAIDQGVYTGVTSDDSGEIDEELSGSAIWWLRTSGYYSGYTAVVVDDGYVHGDGFRINGELHDGYEDHGEYASELGGNIGVRPCIWVDESVLE